MLRFFYCCYFCGKPLFKESFVCAECLVIPYTHTRDEQGLTHQYLFEYDCYSEVFVKYLKYGKFIDVVQQLSHRFLPEDAVVIALPNSKNLRFEKNHSYVLARMIFPNVEIFEPFEKISSKQAGQRKVERKRIKLKLVQDLDINKKVIFVDDLLTTGSTIRHAWEILGKPQAKIVTLCYTPKVK